MYSCIHACIINLFLCMVTIVGLYLETEKSGYPPRFGEIVPCTELYPISDINNNTHTGRWDGPFWLMTSMRACKWRDWAYSIRALIGFLFRAAKLSDVIFREGPELSPTGSDMGPDPNTGWLWDLVMIALSKDNGLLYSILGLITFPMDRIHFR